jgi:hypothetical protein
MARTLAKKCAQKVCEKLCGAQRSQCVFVRFCVQVQRADSNVTPTQFQQGKVVGEGKSVHTSRTCW